MTLLTMEDGVIIGAYEQYYQSTSLSWELRCRKETSLINREKKTQEVFFSAIKDKSWKKLSMRVKLLKT
jgi:hypothetical protein